MEFSTRIEDGDMVIDVPLDVLDRWQIAFKEFGKAQSELRWWRNMAKEERRNPDQETPGSSGCAGMLGSEAGEEAHFNKQPEPPNEK